MVHDFTSSLNKKIRTDAVLLETFDKVSHHYLIEYYGVRHQILQWISSFLNARTQFVTCNGSHSSTVDVVSGVPQGAILGPLLFKYTLMICLNPLYIVYLPMTACLCIDPQMIVVSNVKYTPANYYLYRCTIINLDMLKKPKYLLDSKLNHIEIICKKAV